VPLEALHLAPDLLLADKPTEIDVPGVEGEADAPPEGDPLIAMTTSGHGNQLRCGSAVAVVRRATDGARGGSTDTVAMPKILVLYASDAVEQWAHAFMATLAHATAEL
jgi:hypothetical protein